MSGDNEKIPKTLSMNECFVCSPSNLHGLRLSFSLDASGTARAPAHISADYQGFHGVLHGGVVAALMDDAMWYAIFGTGHVVAMTADLQVRYHHPVPVEEDIAIAGWVVSIKHRLIEAQAEIRQGADKLASAHARFLAVAPAPVDSD
ncbi:MAG: PaaI family thioesterase [Firmicutes bacterium]|nr:PaaI family thioesterase [Bacillota bacterium]